MNFGKFAFGALILAVGVLLLAVRLGFAHPDTPMFLLRYWPLLLIAFGLAFLAGVIKNPFLGCLAILLILGGTVLGIFWMNQQSKQGRISRGVSSIDLGRANVASLTVRVRSFAGAFDFRAAPPRARAVSIGLRGAAGDSAVGYRFEVTGGKGVLEWPQTQGGFGIPPPAAKLEVRVPGTLPMALRWNGWFSSMRADLEGVAAARCALHEVFSSSRIEFDDAGRPDEIRVWGFASSIGIHIPGDCPVRIVSHSPFVLRSFPSDVEELAPGRGKDRLYAVGGRGRPVRIYVGGTFIRIKIERMPLTTVLTREESEWPQPESTASRSRSPSS